MVPIFYAGVQPPAEVSFVDAGVLRIAYVEDGVADGWPVVLSHGFPYDVHAYDEVSAAFPLPFGGIPTALPGFMWSGLDSCQ